MIRDGRFTASLDGDFVVFLIGMRLNKPWKIHKWWPVAMAMGAMLRELGPRPELGLLHADAWFSRTLIVVQYWRSMEQLMAYSRNKEAEHLPAWARFNRAVGSNGDVGIWHETYAVTRGSYENVYVNMPPFGLGAFAEVQPASGVRQSAESRIHVNQDRP